MEDNRVVEPESDQPTEPEVKAAGASELEKRVYASLTKVLDPEIRKPITDMGMVSWVTVDGAGVAEVAIKLTIVGCPAARTIENDVTQAVASTPGVTKTQVHVGVMTRDDRSRLTHTLRGSKTKRKMPFGPDSLTKVYTVTSGKGGVGKSTVTANLAVALAARGLKVGLVDADVHGFSIPGILGLVTDGIAQAPTRVDEMILPPIAYGVKIISIGMFLDPDKVKGHTAAVAWRGPMLHRTIAQFLTDVYFGDLDVLLLDLPPGTGDVGITVGQLLPNADVIVVTTPQPAAADVAERSGILARQTGQSVYGVIENMAGFVQPDGSIFDLFGSGGGAEVAERLSAAGEGLVPLLASVPLSVQVRTGGDIGIPIVISNPDDPASVAINSVADGIAERGHGLSGKPLGVAPV